MDGHAVASLAGKLQSYAAAYPDALTASCKGWASPDAATFGEGVTYGNTNHARLAWKAMVGKTEQAMRASATLGTSWGAAGFVFALRRREGHLQAGFAWVPYGHLPEQISVSFFPFSKAMASWAQRVDILSKGPSATGAWLCPSPTKGNDVPLVAANAREAMIATNSLYRQGTSAPDQGSPLRTLEAATGFEQAATSCAFAGTQGKDVIADMRAAIRAAEQAGRRWGFDDGEDFSTATLALTFLDDPAMPSYVAHSPLAMKAEWDPKYPGGVDFCHESACDARCHIMDFGHTLITLPGLRDAPVRPNAWITVVPGGDVLVGLDINTQKRSKAPHGHETSASGFAKDWAERLCLLDALPEPTSMWRVSWGRFFINEHVVSAATPADAVRAAQLLWGEPGKPLGPTTLVARIPSLSEQGFTWDDVARRTENADT